MEPRIIAKSALAKMYCPELSNAAALRWLRRQIAETKGLKPALERTGYTQWSKKIHFSKAQMSLIISYLGEP